MESSTAVDGANNSLLSWLRGGFYVNLAGSRFGWVQMGFGGFVKLDGVVMRAVAGYMSEPANVSQGSAYERLIVVLRGLEKAGFILGQNEVTARGAVSSGPGRFLVSLEVFSPPSNPDGLVGGEVFGGVGPPDKEDKRVSEGLGSKESGVAAVVFEKGVNGGETVGNADSGNSFVGHSTSDKSAAGRVGNAGSPASGEGSV
ncbi:hypothetical protein [Geminisphaera colitermitum]|uniref:hypothetical protein n=1 Tax=Geminisphaera colitermitum TaxID=1148786 RepID=UPI0012FEEEEC|nr:hypothetical protein [Geminisphaera colitermitum]